MEHDCAQHPIECDHCKKSAVYYCNSCGGSLCRTCKNRPMEGNKNHLLVFYNDRQNPSVITENCKVHPDLAYIMSCEQCSTPVCTRCISDTHKGHTFEDLYPAFNLKQDQCDHDVNKIKRETLPQFQMLLADVTNDFKTTEREISKIRSSMSSAAQSIKDLVDVILFENIEALNGIENTMNATLHHQINLVESHIRYLESIVAKHEIHRESNKPSEFIIFHYKNNITDIKSIPELSQMTFPSFVEGQVDKDAIIRQFGQIEISTTKPLMRQLQDVKLDIIEEDAPTDKIPTLEHVKTVKVPIVSQTRHMSCLNEDKVWVSDDHGRVVLTDMNGNKLDQVEVDVYADNGLHTVTDAGEFLFTDEISKIITRISTDKKTQVVIDTGEWSPISVYSCPSSGDILVGLRRDEYRFTNDGMGKVTKYSKTFKKVLEVHSDNQGRALYGDPYYVSQNINGDICASDLKRQSVIVVDKSGKHKFSYSGHSPDPAFYPSGLCSDKNGRILVINSACRTVHLFDKDGNFLSLILDQMPFPHGSCSTCVAGPQGLCWDGKNNLWVGEYVHNIVKVYKYQ